MLFAPALATYYLALGQRSPVCLFDFALFHIPYENSLFSRLAVTETPDVDDDPTRSSVQVNLPYEDDNDVEEVPREDLKPEISSRDLARIDQTYNYNITPSRVKARSGHLRLRAENMPWQPADFSILDEITQSPDTGRHILTPLIRPSLHEQNTRLIHNEPSTPNKVLPSFPTLSSPSACKKTRASSTTYPREQLTSILNITQNLPSTLSLVFNIAMWASSTQMTHFIPVSREIVIRFNLREVVYHWWSTQLSEATSRKIASQQLVCYFDLEDFVKNWARRSASKANYTKSQNLFLSLSTRQACFLDLEYAPMLSTFERTFISFAIGHQGYPIQSATIQTSDRPLHQLDTLKPNTSPRHIEMLAQALPDSEVRDQVLPKVGTKSSTYGKKSETQPSLETDSIPEAQPPSETDPTPRARRRRPRSTAEFIAYFKENEVPRKHREVSDLSPAARERVRRSFWPPRPRETPTKAVANSASSDKETPQDQDTPDSQPQSVLDSQIPATTSGSPTSVTDGAAGNFAEVAERDQIPSPPTSGSPTAVTDGAAGNFAEVAERDQIPSPPTSGSPTAVTDGAAGNFAGVADGKDGVSDEPGQQPPASLDQSSHTTGPATSVSDGAAVGFAVVDKQDQGDAELVSSSPLPVDLDSTKTTKKGRKHKGKGIKRSKTQDFAFRRRMFEEHRSTAKREDVVDLDLLATLSEGMNGKDIFDVFFLM